MDDHILNLRLLTGDDFVCSVGFEALLHHLVCWADSFEITVIFVVIHSLLELEELMVSLLGKHIAANQRLLSDHPTVKSTSSTRCNASATNKMFSKLNQDEGDAFELPVASLKGMFVHMNAGGDVECYAVYAPEKCHSHQLFIQLIHAITL